MTTSNLCKSKWRPHYEEWLKGERVSEEFSKHMDSCKQCFSFLEVALNTGKRKKSAA